MTSRENDLLLLVSVPDTFEMNLFPRLSLLSEMMLSLSLVHSSLAMKDISRMICHLKFVLAWISLLPRLSGFWDFVLFCVYFRLSSLN